MSTKHSENSYDQGKAYCFGQIELQYFFALIIHTSIFIDVVRLPISEKRITFGRDIFIRKNELGCIKRQMCHVHRKVNGSIYFSYKFQLLGKIRSEAEITRSDIPSIQRRLSSFLILLSSCKLTLSH